MREPRALHDQSLSIVIPCFRSEHTISRAVYSALAQVALSEVIVVVDDGTSRVPDGLTSILDPRLKVVVNERNFGAQFSRNKGLAEVRSKFVLFLDADDFISPDFSSEMINRLQAEKGDICFGPFLLLDERRNRVERTVPSFADSEALVNAWLYRQGYVPPCSVLWRTSFIRDIGGWDQSLARNQDGELVLRGVLDGGKIATCATGFGVYVQHEGEFRITRSSKNLDSLLKVVHKLKDRPSAVLPTRDLNLALGRYLLRTAANAYRQGHNEFGARAQTLARELGCRRPAGSRLERWATWLIGLRAYHGMAGRARLLSKPANRRK